MQVVDEASSTTCRQSLPTLRANVGLNILHYTSLKLQPQQSAEYTNYM